MQTTIKYIISAVIGYIVYSAISAWGYVANEAKGGTSPGYETTAVVMGIVVFLVLGWLLARIKE